MPEKTSEELRQLTAFESYIKRVSRDHGGRYGTCGFWNLTQMYKDGLLPLGMLKPFFSEQEIEQVKTGTSPIGDYQYAG